MQPKYVTADDFKVAVEQVKKKKNLTALPKLRFESFHEGPSAQILHIGPYSAEENDIGKIHAFIHSSGHTFSGKHHEIYLNNPQTTAPETLKESELRLRFHAENIPLAVVEWDRNFVVTRWAGDAEKMFGWTSAETVGKPIMDLHMIYAPDIPIVEKTMVRLTSGETKVVSSNRNITKDGRVIYCTWYNSVLLDKKGKMASVFSFVEDCTSRIAAEEALEETNRNLEKLVEERTRQLRDSERLAAIGATAGMVGHDIRNPLQAITGDVYLAKVELEAVPESPEKKNALESLHEIEKNIDYINKIVADLQDFARPLKPNFEEADMKLIINELLAKNHLPENIKVSVKVESEARKRYG